MSVSQLSEEKWLIQNSSNHLWEFFLTGVTGKVGCYGWGTLFKHNNFKQFFNYYNNTEVQANFCMCCLSWLTAWGLVTEDALIISAHCVSTYRPSASHWTQSQDGKLTIQTAPKFCSCVRESSSVFMKAGYQWQYSRVLSYSHMAFM